jgi:hypothetical protein
VKLTDSWITGVCINVSKQPFSPGSLKLVMAAASFICSYDAMILSNYTYTAQVWQAKPIRKIPVTR